MTDERGQNLWLRRELPLLLLILAIGAGFRIARISFDSLDIDDLWHLELSTGRGSPHVRLPSDQVIENAPAATSLKDAPPFYAIWTHMDFVVHPPLYCTLLRLWRDVFGEGDVAARSFSIVCWLSAIVLMFIAGRQLNGLAPAAWAAMIFATAPTQILLSEQVRAYGLMCAMGMGALVALVRLEKSPESAWKAAISLGLCTLGMMLSHYFAIGASLAIGAYVLLRLRGMKLKMAIISLAGAAVVFLIAWGPFLLRQRAYFAQTADVWLIEKTPEHLGYTFGRLASWCWWLIART
ncbi:MAG TPA: glycosyltransferase family 39 protein, partial [Tepidisphaeraceae bacterium]|nr:glycosyltransferase family 39 protein [Tepidisphaeraceae bacterium]